MSPKCEHGYWTHQYIPCPWCHGFSEMNKNVIPVQGPGNGWLLEEGVPTCPDCGGPGGQDGIIPDYMTWEYYKEVIFPQPRPCMDCAKARGKKGLAIPRPEGYEESEVPQEVKQEAARQLEEAEAKAARSRLRPIEYPERF